MDQMKVYALQGGQKGLAISDIEDLSDLQFFQDALPSELDTYFARVAALYRAVDMSAQTLAHLPFALVTKGGEDYDTSAAWENKVGFWPKPQQFLERVRKSLFFNNYAYGLIGRNVAGKPKNLYYLVPGSIRPITDLKRGEIVRFERYVNGAHVNDFSPDDPSLVKIWKLDHTTELLPSKNTEALAAMNAAGILYAQDYWIKNFFAGGGVKPTVIAVKGALTKEKQEELQTAWDKFTRFISKLRSKVINADAMQVETFGDGVADMKDNQTKDQAIADVAMAANMPLSLLLANSANEATATQEYRTWFRDSVIPWAEFVAEELNEQVFIPMGLRLEFRPEATDPEQEDEVQRAQALLSFGDVFTKYPTFDLLMAAAVGIYGFEIPPEFEAAAKKYYADKEKKAEELQKQMAQTQPAAPGEQQPQEKPQGSQFPPRQEQQPPAPAKWVPGGKELKELRVMQEVYERAFKRGQSLDFEYNPHYGGLPDEIMGRIKARLHFARSLDDISDIFELKDEPAPASDDRLVRAIETLAARYPMTAGPVST